VHVCGLADDTERFLFEACETEVAAVAPMWYLCRPYFKDGSTGDMANLSEDEGAASDAAVSAPASGPVVRSHFVLSFC